MKRNLKILHARSLLAFMVLAPLVLVPAVRAATMVELSGDLVLIGDPNAKTFVGAGLISIETNGR